MFDFGRNDEIVPDRPPRRCTCHPSEAPIPCQRKYAFSECAAAARRYPNLRGDIAAALIVLALMLIGGLLDG